LYFQRLTISRGPEGSGSIEPAPEGPGAGFLKHNKDISVGDIAPNRLAAH